MTLVEDDEAAVSDLNGKQRAAFVNLGVNEVVDSLDDSMQQLQDFDGSQLPLYQSQYKVGDSQPMNALVIKGSSTKKLTAVTFKHLLGLKNNKVLVPVLCYYHRGSNQNGWFIIPPVNGSLKGCLANYAFVMFEGNGIKRAMSGTFRKMLIDMWDLLSKMFVEKIVPMHINLEDFFVTVLADEVPRIQLLITEFKEVRRAGDMAEEKERIWLEIDAVISECCKLCGCEFNEVSKKFCEYIKTHDTIEKIKSYPDTWTVHDKSRYMYMIMSGKPPFKRHVMRSKVNIDSKVGWPIGQYGYPKIISLILALEENNYIVVNPNGEKVVVCRYQTSEPYDYIKLCRDNHKHFDELPVHIKDLIGQTRESWIHFMEYWDPEIWTKLYEAVGPLGSQLGS
ncbi:unnamed protein product [Urochloa humidicola]